MKRGLRVLPSFGCMLVVAGYALLLAFLAWGYTRPELDRAWYILQHMQREGFAGLTQAESQVLEHLLKKHPQFSYALLGKNPIGFVEPTEDGWIALPHSHLAIQASPNLPLRVIVECRAPQGAYPINIVLETDGLQRKLQFLTDAQRLIDVSTLAGPRARWVSVTIAANQATAAPRRHPEIRVRTQDDGSPRATP